MMVDLRYKDIQQIHIAACREAAWHRDPEVDLPHLFLALLALGSSNSAALAAEGVTLMTARQAWKANNVTLLEETGIESHGLPDIPTLTIKELRQYNAVHIPWTPRAHDVLYGHRGNTQQELLLALVNQRHSGVCDILQCCGVRVDQALSALNLVTTDEVSSTRGKFPAPAGIQSGELPGVQLRFFIGAQSSTVLKVTADPESFSAWFWTGRDTELTSTGDIIVLQGKATYRLVLKHVSETNACWEEVHHDWQLGWRCVETQLCDGGCWVTLTKTFRPFGPLGQVFVKHNQRGTERLLRGVAQDLAFICADTGF